MSVGQATIDIKVSMYIRELRIFSFFFIYFSYNFKELQLMDIIILFSLDYMTFYLLNICQHFSTDLKNNMFPFNIPPVKNLT